MKRYAFLILASIIFILPKLFSIGIRLSDSNIYFYTAYELIHGKILYKDIFFTNFPLFPYLSTLYYFLTLKQLSLYYITASAEVIATAWILFHIVIRQYKDPFLANITSVLYLFSFIVLSTSDHQTGVFSAALFAVLSYFFMEKKQYIWAGIMTGCMIMMKAYYLPIAFAFSTVLVLRILENKFHTKSNKQSLFYYFLSFFSTVLVIIFPSFLFAQKEFFHDVFAYSLTRSQGVSKMNILWFLVKHDLLLIILFIYSFFSGKKHAFFSLVSFFSLLFFILYKDIYYLYLNFIIPFLCLIFPIIYLNVLKKMHIQKAIILTVLFIFFLTNYAIYISGYARLGKVPDISPLVATIRKEKPHALYGVNDITPALAYLTNTPLLNNIVDTNENIFRKGFLDRKQLTADAVNSHSLIVTHGAVYPEVGVNQAVIGGIFNTDVLKKSCHLIQSLPVKTEGIENRINLFRCF